MRCTLRGFVPTVITARPMRQIGPAHPATHATRGEHHERALTTAPRLASSARVRVVHPCAHVLDVEALAENILDDHELGEQAGEADTPTRHLGEQRRRREHVAAQRLLWHGSTSCCCSWSRLRRPGRRSSRPWGNFMNHSARLIANAHHHAAHRNPQRGGVTEMNLQNEFLLHGPQDR